MSQFHITDSNSLRIAREALHHRKPITTSGMVGKGPDFLPEWCSPLRRTSSVFRNDGG